MNIHNITKVNEEVKSNEEKMIEFPYDLTDEQKRKMLSNFSIENPRAQVITTMHQLNDIIQDYSSLIFRLTYHYNPAVREALADEGYALDVLYKDSSPLVRAAVARKGYYLEELTKDEDPDVQAAVLDYLLTDIDDDKADMIRSMVRS